MRQLLTGRLAAGVGMVLVATALAGCAPAADTGRRAGGGDLPYGTDAVERWAAAQVDCLRGAGWDAVMIDAGYEVRDVTPERRDEFVRARGECAHRVGPRPAGSRPDDREVLAQYRALLRLRECLEREGYDVADPPPPERFLASRGARPWHPYESLAAKVGAAEWERLNRVCPQPAA